jgi:hypothetical protein
MIVRSPATGIRNSCVVGLFLTASACGRIETVVGELARDSGAPVSVYLEAESGRLAGGFTIETDPAASGGKYILPPAGVQSPQSPGNASAEYVFSVQSSRTYLLWGRIRAPTVSSNSFWVSMDDGPSSIWHLSTGVIWFWGTVTSGTDYTQPNQYPLSAGTHRLVFRNAADGVGLDILYVTVPGDMPPGNHTPCQPPNSIELADGGCEPSCGSHGRDTTCGQLACAGQPALPAYDCFICCFASDAGPDSGATD